MKKTNKFILPIIVSLIITVFLMYPYLVSSKLPLEHDTLFHLSRIEGYSNALKNKDFIPRIYPYKNDGFGYASPIFYCDIFLIIPAIMYNLNIPLTTAYKSIVFIATFFSCLTMYLLVYKVSKNKYASILASISYSFSNYHISDIYIRSALGEIFALVFFPIVLLGIYELLYKEERKIKYLVIGFSGLLLSHNISFLFGIIVFSLFIIINYKKIIKTKIIILSILKATTISILLCLFYILPMLEMYFSDDLFVNYYSYSKYLVDSALEPWQFITNKTVFGLGFTYNEKIMVVNIGLFLTFIPVLYFFNKNKDRFILNCLIIGYAFIFLTSNIIPWKYLGFLSIIQFTWRLNLISMTLLSVVASITIAKLKIKWLNIIIVGLLFVECYYHISPVLNRTFTIDNKTKYKQIISDEVIDPYFAATYVRTELAGGEYLPISTPDIKMYGTCIKTTSGDIITCEYVRSYNKFIFNTDYVGDVSLPITYYKGYKIYRIENNKMTPIKVKPSTLDLVSFYSESSGEYLCVYNKTLIQKYSVWISFFSLVGFMVYYRFSGGKKYV